MVSPASVCAIRFSILQLSALLTCSSSYLLLLLLCISSISIHDEMVIHWNLGLGLGLAVGFSMLTVTLTLQLIKDKGFPIYAKIETDH